MVSSPRHRGLHGLARWLVASVLLFQAAHALNGRAEVYLPGAGWRTEDHFFGSWLVLAASPRIQHILLLLITGLTFALVVGWWRRRQTHWLHWWAAAAGLLIAAEWRVTDQPRLDSGWIAVLSLSAVSLLFLLAVAMLVCTGGSWVRPLPAKEDFQRPGIFALGAFLTAGLFAQAVLGAGFSHAELGITAHLLCTLVVTPLLVCLVGLVLQRHPEMPLLRWPAICLASLLPLQLGLGAWSYLIRIRQPQGVWLPPRQQLLAGEFHLLCGALLAAASLLLTLRARKHLTARVISSPPTGGALEA